MSFRNYKRKSQRTPITPEIFQRAKALLQTGLSKRHVARELGFSEGALRKRLKLDCGATKLGRFEKVFNTAQENELAEHAMNLEKLFYGLTLKSLRKLAYEYATANNINHTFPQETKMAGKDWASSFMKRYNLSLRTASKTSVARAMGFNKLQIDRYFDNLKLTMEKYKFPASRIFNMDESGLSTVPNKTPKVVSKKGQKLVGKIVSAERGQTVTVVCCMSAAGNYVPPAMIFPRKRRKPELADGAPPGTILFTSDSGYINTDLFLEWLNHFQSHVKSSAEDPTLLVLDNHSSHVSLQATLFAREHNIHIVTLPPHSSHKTQPLDRCFFKPLKDFYSQACEQWLLNNPGRTITQYQVASLFSEAYQRAATIGKAVTSFKTCGIFPMNSSVFGEEDFLPSTVTDQQELFEERHINATATEKRSDTMPPPHLPMLNLSTVSSAQKTSATTGSASSKTSIEPTLSQEPSVQNSKPSSCKLVAGKLATHLTAQETYELKNLQTNESQVVLEDHSTPSTSGTSQYTSPSQLMPLPKRKCSTFRTSKGKKSVILTSTPIKDELEALAKAKQIKENNKGKRNVFGSSNVKGSLAKEKERKTATETSFEKKLKNKAALRRSEENVSCPGCEETYNETPNDDWVQCNHCEEWWHEACSPYEGVGAFVCDYCV